MPLTNDDSLDTSISSTPSLYNRVYLVLFAASILVLPFSYQVSFYCIYANAFVWLLQAKTHIRNFDRALLLPFLIFSSLYVIQWIGLIHTDNFSWGMSRTETKLSLFIFPLLVLISFIGQREVVILKWVFVCSSTLAALWCHLVLIRTAIAEHISWLDVLIHYEFRTVYFVAPLKIHPTYLTIFVAFSFFLLTELVSKKKPGRRFWILTLALAYYGLVSFEAASRAGIFIFVLTLLGVSVSKWLSEKPQKWKTIVFVLAILIVMVGIFSNKLIQEKFFTEFKSISDAGLMASQGSVSQHIKSWYCAVELIWSDHFLFGYGTGDEKDILGTCYAAQGWEQMAQQKNDAHNEFLSSGIRHGIIGLGQLVFFFIYIFHRAWKTNDRIYLIFLVMFFLVSLAESTLKARTGVVFFAMFNALLFKDNYLKYKFSGST